jgi:hypothetical protein
MKILDTYNEFSYTYYELCDKLNLEYNRMYGIIKSDGHSLSSNKWPLEAGILLENKNNVIAGAFFNLNNHASSILMLLVFVEEIHRKKGIYKKLHFLVDDLGKKSGKTSVYSYIHVNNSIMQNHVSKSIGYSPVMNLVRRSIK